VSAASIGDPLVHFVVGQWQAERETLIANQPLVATRTRSTSLDAAIFIKGALTVRGAATGSGQGFEASRQAPAAWAWLLSRTSTKQNSRPQRVVRARSAAVCSAGRLGAAWK